MRLLILVALASTLLTTPTLAAPPPPTLAPSMNVGAFGLVGSPTDGWLSQYMYFGPSLLISPAPWFNFVLMASLEVAPGLGNWGFTFTPILEFVPPGSPVAIDLMPSIIQDTAPAQGGTVAIWAVGPGANILFPSGITLCLGFQVAGIVGDPTAGVTFNPLVNLGLPLPTPAKKS